MYTLEGMRKTYRYNAWANGRAIESLKNMTNRSAKALRALSHLVLAEREWLTRLHTSTDNTGFNFWQELSLEECEALNAENQRQFKDFLDSLDEDGLEAIAVYKNTRGIEYRTPFREILLHVSFHSAYHRGQLASAVRAEGGTPNNTDYIFFQREAG